MYTQANCFFILKLFMFHQEDLGAVEGRTSEKSETESDQERGSGRGTVMATAKRVGALTKITLVAQRTKQMTMAGPLSAAEQQPHLIWLKSNSSLLADSATNWLKDSS